MPVVQCVVPGPVLVSSCKSLLSQAQTTAHLASMLDGVTHPLPASAMRSSAIAVSISWTWLMDTQCSNLLSSVTSSEQPVMFRTVIARLMCFGVLIWLMRDTKIKFWTMLKICWLTVLEQHTRSWRPWLFSGLSSFKTQERKLYNLSGTMLVHFSMDTSFRWRATACFHWCSRVLGEWPFLNDKVLLMLWEFPWWVFILKVSSSSLLICASVAEELMASLVLK